MKTLSTLLLALVIFSCAKKNELNLIDEASFTKGANQAVRLFTLKNKNGLTTQITNFGGRIVNLWIPDRNGNFADIVLGYDSYKKYLASNEIYYGALIGRYGNRIAKGRFILDDTEYKLATNNGDNHLHGGKVGFNDVIWKAKQIDHKTLELRYFSKHLEEGYPGNLDIKVIYQLNDSNELKIEYEAQTDRPTVVNLTHHSFFNLHGAGNGTINDHKLFIDANTFTPVDKGLIPTGEIRSVSNTPFDFTTPTTIGSRINDDNKQLKFGAGYDHNWVLNPTAKKVRLAATISDSNSGRIMDVFTNEPSIQFYGGNFLSGKDCGKYDKTYNHRSAFCLETQHYPDSPNRPNFPSTRLTPTDKYYSVCIYRFRTNNGNEQ